MVLQNVTMGVVDGLVSSLSIAFLVFAGKQHVVPMLMTLT
jgi:hypothetical protein